ncbi:hypothetical protein V6N11_079624 [Hibiscus sabdariffa]|uniref:Uncharacterized protein n=1 Tax=Hibiscus sabdariffa TaxID=183260 RepID=A0ABR2RVY3_9ROSI
MTSPLLDTSPMIRNGFLTIYFSGYGSDRCRPDRPINVVCRKRAAPKDYDILAIPLTNAAPMRNGTPEELRQYF